MTAACMSSVTIILSRPPQMAAKRISRDKRKMGAFPLNQQHKKVMKKTKHESKSESKNRPLPEGFVPGEKDVICGRGKMIQNHPGNRFYRETIEHFLPHYAQAKCKLDKSIIVSSVVAAVRDNNPNGGFVREENGRWYEASDFLVRERIGSSLRDMLHSKYSSSTKSKKARRQQVQDKLSGEVAEMLQRQDCKEIVSCLEKVSNEIDDDDKLQEAFNKANMELLRALKNGDEDLKLKQTAPAEKDTPQGILESLSASGYADQCEGSEDTEDMEPLPI